MKKRVDQFSSRGSFIATFHKSRNTGANVIKKSVSSFVRRFVINKCVKDPRVIVVTVSGK